MNMKKIIAVAALTGAVAAPAFADGLDDVRFYLGGELNYNSPSWTKVETTGGASFTAKKKKPGFGVLAGAKFNEFVGAEIGYNFFKKSNNNTVTGAAGKGTAKLSNMYADVIGYLAVAPEVDLLGSVGFGRMKPKVTVDNATMKDGVNKAKVGYRLGAGAQYKFDDNLAARLMVRYQKGKKSSAVKSLTQAGLGLTYTF